jgi:predicted HAD superfamily Cof-like phosphohydrolase
MTEPLGTLGTHLGEMINDAKINPNLLTIIGAFMRIGGQTTDALNPQQATLYVGLVLEEVAEMIETIAGGSVTQQDCAHLLGHADQIKLLSGEFKKGLHMGDLLRCDREELLDAFIDTAWVAVGAAYSVSHNTAGAVAEVGRANLSKYPNGQVLRDENGKIMKPPHWRGPDLSPFVGVPEGMHK